jgi:hypothetical protein
MNMTIDDALRIVSISYLWDHFGYEGSPKNSCCSPFRPDKKPSFSVREKNGIEFFRDYSTGDSGNSIHFYTLATGCDKKEATKAVIELAGGKCNGNAARKAKRLNRDLGSNTTRKERKPFDGDLQIPTDDDLEQLCKIRGLEVCLESLKLMVDRGLLWVTRYGFNGNTRKCFAITDQSRLSVDLRPYDGQPWWDDVKSICPKGYTHDWPVGLQEVVDGDYQLIMLVEGSGDAMAAHRAIYSEGRNIDRPNFQKVAVVAILGAGNDIPDEAQKYLEGRSVVIYPDNDAAGHKALKRWGKKLKKWCYHVGWFDISKVNKPDGTPIKDLGEYMTFTRQELNDHRDVCPQLERRAA